MTQRSEDSLDHSTVDDLLDLERKIEEMKSELFVKRDLIRRAGWYLGTDIQSSPPTIEETQMFLEELRGARNG